MTHAEAPWPAEAGHQGHAGTATWQDPEFARAWTRNDQLEDMLALPRQLAAALVELDRPECRLILDVASGPGAFLATFLDRFPAARGISSDASPTMLETARRRLARYGDRVSFVLADMTGLLDADLPSGIDVVCTSRASHHLDRAGLAGVYQDAAQLLAPGGWVVNLDHFGPDEPWNTRLRTIRRQFVSQPPAEPGSEQRPAHHHTYPLVSATDHLDALDAAGITETHVPWRAFNTCLIVGRTPDVQAG